MGHSPSYVPADPFTLAGPEAEAVLAVMDEWDVGFVWGLHIGTRIQLANEFARAVIALAEMGLVEVAGAETCRTHIDGVLLETGNGTCDVSDDDKECRGAPLYRYPSLSARST